MKKNSNNKHISSSSGKHSSPANSFPIVVVGASAGGYVALLQMADHLPLKSDAAIFVVLHLTELSNVSFLAQHLQKHTGFHCKLATEGETIKKRTFYFGLHGMHLLFSKNKILYGKGADENNFKPSIDVMFRSAAVEFRERVIGVILSGLMDDGVAGMMAIKMCGGTCIVQEPTEAEYPAMPLAVIDKMKPDYTLPVAEIGEAIWKISQEPKVSVQPPGELVEETEISRKMLTHIDNTMKLGVQSLFTCPDCGGVLFNLNEGKLSRYRCFTGHAYSEAALLEKQDHNIRSTLWIALRVMEERKKMLEKFPALKNNNETSNLSNHIKKLKNLLADLVKLNGEEEIIDI